MPFCHEAAHVKVTTNTDKQKTKLPWNQDKNATGSYRYFLHICKRAVLGRHI